MYYIFYKFKTGKVGYIEYLKEADALEWILKEGGRCLEYKILEAIKTYRVGLIEIGKEKSVKKCRKCGSPISGQNTSGFCNSCIASTRLETSERLCIECGKNKITEWNKSGLCTACRQKRGHKLINEKRKKQRQEKKKQKTKTSTKSPGEKGKCRKCGESFSLESWQHSSLHWCPECRKSPDYKEFKEQ